MYLNAVEYTPGIYTPQEPTAWLDLMGAGV